MDAFFLSFHRDHRQERWKRPVPDMRTVRTVDSSVGMSECKPLLPFVVRRSGALTFCSIDLAAGFLFCS